MGNRLIMHNAIGIDPAVNEIEPGQHQLVYEVGDHGAGDVG